MPLRGRDVDHRRSDDVGQVCQECNGYGVRWHELGHGQASPVPQTMLTQWLAEDRGAPRTGEDIRQLLEQSRHSHLPTPSLERLIALRTQNAMASIDDTAENPVDTSRENNIMDEEPLEYVGYDLIPESEVATVHGLLEDYYRPTTHR